MAVQPSINPATSTIALRRETEATRGVSSPGVRRQRRRRQIRLTTFLLGCGIAAVVAARWWASREAIDIGVVADEPGYLSIARLFAQAGVHWNMGIAGSYSPGYGVLLTPIFWLGGSGSAIYRHVIWLNVALGAVPLLLLFVLARRTTDLSPPLAAVAATAISLAPAVVGHSGLAWSENLVPAAFLLLLLASLHLVRHPNPRAAAAVALLAPIAYAVHARLLPSAVVALGVIAVVGVQRRLRVRWTIGTIFGAALLIVGVRKGVAVIDHTLYIRAGSQAAIRLSRLTQVGTILVEAAGQFWYLLVTTAGLVGFGVLALLRGIRHGAQGSTPPTQHASHALDRPQALVIAAQCGITVATSIVVTAGGVRPDKLVYGRYNDAVTGPVLILGIAALCRARPRSRRVVDAAIVAGATVAMAAVLWAFRQDELRQRSFLGGSVFGLVALTGASPTVNVGRATLIGLALIAGVALVAALQRRALLLIALSAAAAVGVVRLAPLVRPGPTVGAGIANVEQVSALLRTQSTVAYSMASGAPLNRFYQYQLHLPDVRFELDTPARPQAAATFAMARDTGMAQSGARLAYIDPYTGVGLWVPPGGLQNSLDQRGELLPAGFPAPLPLHAMQGRVTFASPPQLVDRGRRIKTSVRVERIGRGAPWPVHQGAIDPRGTVRLAISVTDPRCGCVVRNGRADFLKMVPPGPHRVTVDVDEALSRTQRLHPGRYQIEVQLLQENVGLFGTPASARAVLAH